MRTYALPARARIPLGIAVIDSAFKESAFVVVADEGRYIRIARSDGSNAHYAKRGELRTATPLAAKKKQKTKKASGNPSEAKRPEYPFYVTINNEIVGGWHYREDAQEQIAEIKEGVGIKATIVAKRTAEQRGLKWATKQIHQMR